MIEAITTGVMSAAASKMVAQFLAGRAAGDAAESAEIPPERIADLQRLLKADQGATSDIGITARVKWVGYCAYETCGALK